MSVPSIVHAIAAWWIARLQPGSDRYMLPCVAIADGAGIPELGGVTVTHANGKRDSCPPMGMNM